MARPKKAISSTEKTICIPTPVVLQVDLLLFSELEGRVPHGAWAGYVTGLIMQDLEKRKGVGK